MPQLQRSESASSRGGLLLEAGDAHVVVVHDDAVQRRVVDLLDGHGRDAAGAPVGGQERGEVDVGEAVAAHDEEGAGAEEVAERRSAPPAVPSSCSSRL